ncbi:MAG TPA: M1 family aminopeptidase [Fibrobacteria bacterium]|nr:M1 family aminopeptidase [Fibrobacteria bacterium]
MRTSGRPFRFLLPAIAALLEACGGKSPPQPPPARHPLRLDANAVPLAQDLFLALDPDSAGYSGRTDIELAIGNPSDSLRLHSEGVTIRTAYLEQGGRRIPLDTATRPAGILALRSREPFRSGKAALHIEFSRDFNTQSTSLYQVKIGGRNYVFSQFEAWDARKAFPCFDEPAFKIPWNVSVLIPSRAAAVGNYPVASETAEGARKRIAFARSDPMPSYLVALAVGEFDSVAIPGMSVPGRVYTVKGQSGLAGHAAAMAGPLLTSLEGYFGGRCPFPKLDLIAVPEFMAGAMENPGAITFRENLLLMDSGEATSDRRSRLASVMAHEMSHLWFGDLVTMAWWNDLWLNESFASWMGDKTVETVFPRFKVSVGSVNGRQWALALDGMPTARAIRTEILPTDNPSQSFDGLAYEKGQEVLGMLEAWMGEAVFQKGVKEYLRTWSWKNARAGDLWAALAAAGGKDVDSLMAGFLDQAGVPLVEVGLDGKNVRLKQKRFLVSARAAADGRRWRIPMVFRCLSQTGREYHARYLLEGSGAEFALGEETLALCHPNPDERGYYRWNLSPAAMDSLAAHAPRFLTERERMALVGDLESLSHAGLMGSDALLERLRPIAADTSPQVLRALVGALESVDSDLIDSASEGGYAAYVSSLMLPVMRRIGWKAAPGEGELVPDLRAATFSLLARQGRDAEAGKQGEALAALYLKDPRKVDPSLVKAALSVAAARGGMGLFRAYRKAFETAATPVSRELFLSALGAFRDPGAADSALDYALHGPLRPHELTAIPRQLGSRREYRKKTLAWVMANLETLIRRRPLEDAAYLPWFASRSGPEKWAEAKAGFMEWDARIPGLAKEMEKVEAEVDRVADLRARDREKVITFLAGYERGYAAGK